MSKRYIFIIATQHHLIQFRRAVSHFQIEGNCISLIIFTNDSVNSWIDELRNEYPFTDICSFDNWTFKDLFFNRTIITPYISHIQELRQQYSDNILFLSQYSNDYSLLAISILKPTEIYILDEGTANFMVSNKRKAKRRRNVKLIIKSLLYVVNLSFPKPIVYFSQYDIHLSRKEDRLVKYSFDIIDNELVVDDKSVILLGTSLTELGILKEETYLKIIETIMDNFKGKTVSYYAHRKENKNKMHLIRLLGLSVVENSKPFEYLFPDLIHNMPSVICSFASPIIDTLSKQYKNIPEFRMYRIPSSCYKKKSIIENMLFHSFSQNPRIKIIDLAELMTKN